MADLSDVENAISDELIAAFYPSGITEPSVVGVTCRVFRGWPAPAILNSDLAAGVVNVTVCPATTPDEVSLPYFDTYYGSTPPTSLQARVTGGSVTLSGITKSNQVFGMLVDGKPYIYHVTDGDSVQNVLANIGVMINADRSTVLSASKLSIPGVIYLNARVVTDAVVSKTLRRQCREVQINCWCPTPVLRDSVSQIADRALAASPFIDIPDGTKAHASYVSTRVYDQSQNAMLYRRDLFYKCDYTLISTSPVPVMLFGRIVKDGNSSFV